MASTTDSRRPSHFSTASTLFDREADFTTCKDKEIRIDENSQSELQPSEKEFSLEPTDGGLIAWAQVLVGMLFTFNGAGYLYSFSFFQAYYSSELHFAPSNVSWIGSIQFFLIYFIGSASGRATDLGYYRHAAVLGSFLQIFGVFMTSLSVHYYQFLLAQGFCQGIGNALLYTPTVALVSTYFSKRRSLALAIVNTGTALGGIVFPIVAQRLEPRMGFSWMMRVMGFIMIFNAAVALVLARPRKVLRNDAPLVDFTAFKDVWFSLFGAGMLLALLGQYIGYFYIVPFAQDVIHVSPAVALNVLLVSNAMGLPGRVIPAWIADRYTGPFNMLLILVLTTCTLTFGWSGITSLGGLWTFAVLYGFSASGFTSMCAASVARVKTDPSKYGVHQGMIFSMMSFGLLCGPPSAGALVQLKDGEYLYAQIFGGIALISAAAVLAISRSLVVGWSPFRPI